MSALTTDEKLIISSIVEDAIIMRHLKMQIEQVASRMEETANKMYLGDTANKSELVHVHDAVISMVAASEAFAVQFDKMDRHLVEAIKAPKLQLVS